MKTRLSLWGVDNSRAICLREGNKGRAIVLDIVCSQELDGYFKIEGGKRAYLSTSPSSHPKGTIFLLNMNGITINGRMSRRKYSK